MKNELDQAMEEYALLGESGCLGQYQSARLTVVTLHDRETKQNTLVFTRTCLQVSSVAESSPHTDFYKLTTQYGYAITAYDIELSTAMAVYRQCAAGCTEIFIQEHPFRTDSAKRMTPRYTGPSAGYRENDFLAKAAQGSHWIEFFNEDKRSVQLIYDAAGRSLLKKLAHSVLEKTGINLERASDRIGNVIFQFPVTTFSADIRWKEGGVIIKPAWHLEGGEPPHVFVQAMSLDENSIVDYQLEQYEGQEALEIPLRTFDTGLKIRFFRKGPDLLLYEWQCDCGQITGIHVTMEDEKPAIRSFVAEGETHSIRLHWPNGAFNPIHHANHTAMALSRVKSQPAYRQFEGNQHPEALSFLRELVAKTRSREILMIDPYLRSDDILNVLYFSRMYGVRMRAIGSALSDISDRLDEGAIGTVSNGGSKREEAERIASIISEQRKILEDPRNSTLGLTLEFRLQHGSFGFKMHDRFLLFPGYPPDLQEPVAYAIGTSFNSVGKSYHVIGSLEGPQDIIDSFEKQWHLVSDPSCLVFKKQAGHFSFSAPTV